MVQIITVVVTLLLPILAVVQIVNMVKFWKTNARTDIRDYNWKPHVRIVVIIAVTIVAAFIYFNLSMGTYPDEQVVVDKARAYLVEKYGQESLNWRLKTVGRKKVYDGEPPTKFIRLEFSSSVARGQLRVECTNYERTGDLVVRELVEKSDN